MHQNISHIFFLLLSLLTMVSCREEQIIIPAEEEQIPHNDHITGDITGFYLLNEGNMGSNKATLDYYDYSMGTYHRNIYAQANPNVVKELGDVGNDIKIYGTRLYAVINCSHKVEVMETGSTKSIGRIDIPNCRYITFYNDKAYVSSYAGPVQIDPNAQLGFIAEIDTLTLKITRKVTVGYQPEEMVVHNNKLYVANSGGYRVPNYDNTISVIDLNSFTELKKIEVGINLHRMEKDSEGNIWVSSRGDYYTTPSNLFTINTETDTVQDTLNIPTGNMCIIGDSLYLYSVEFSYLTGKNTITYGIINTKTKKLITDKLITDGTDKNIKIPYGLAVHPIRKEFYITDAQDYVSTGFVYYYNSDGTLKWKTKAGNIPAHIVFTTKKDHNKYKQPVDDY